MKTTEGLKQQQAAGPDFSEHDVIADMKKRMAEEYARQSDAAESGAKTKLFLEQTGCNSQAYAWGKSIMKKLPKKDGVIKARDVITSLRAVLDVVEEFVDGYGQGELSLDVMPAPAPAAAAPAPEEKKPAAKRRSSKAKEPAPEKPKRTPRKKAEAAPEPEKNEELADEAAAFDKAADEALGGGGNITPFDPSKVRAAR